jgi:hypothetical protein
MGWLVVVAVLVVVGGIGVVVNVNRVRFTRRVAQEMRDLVAVPRSKLPRIEAPEIPAPVARYRGLALGDRAPVRTLRLHHRGTFQLSAKGKPMPIDGTQLFTADPPGFVWTGRIHMAPGLWVDARDMAIDGSGSMRVLFDDTIRIADLRGPQLDQGSALRLLAEMVWYPTALFDARYVAWAPVDASHARATLRLPTGEVAGLFEFGADGLPTRMSAERYDDKGALRPWGGTYADWRTVSGMRVPFEAEVSWELPAGTFTYARWRVATMTYDE